MSSIGRVTAALGAAQVENTIALANINFDFSLIRVDAPPEFRQLGSNLSGRRRQEAETGTPHRVARKLGALFAGVLPRTPKLIQAYGLRLSEISQSNRHNPKGNSSDGPFSAHVGADGTAIWAAATSGTNAIPILMLTCLLARIWSGPEATSLWVELVEHRRHEIQTECTNDEAALFAAQQDISRSQLADWDASARAWLRTADEVKSLQQTQLMLVVNNLQLPVSNNTSVYQSVIKSSETALLLMENLLNGQPQRAGTGAFLLGLSAWHLYPDMVVHGTVTKKIEQKDDLCPKGGVVTLGLESVKGAGNGIYWSLPLAHLRYYGDPVQSSRSTGDNALRVSMDQLVYVSLGSLSANWGKKPQEIKEVLSWFSLLWHCFKRVIPNTGEGGQTDTYGCASRDAFLGSGWLKILMVAASSYPSLRDQDKDLANRLMGLGYRQFPNFLAEPGYHVPPYFGLLAPSALFPLLKDDDERINALRRVAQQLGLAGAKVIIRYKRTGFQDALETGNGDLRHWLSAYEYATAFPMGLDANKTKSSEPVLSKPRHNRWIATCWHKQTDTFAIGDPREQEVIQSANGPDWVDKPEDYRSMGALGTMSRRAKIRAKEAVERVKTAKGETENKHRNRLLRQLQKTKSSVCRCVNGCKSECLCKEFEYGCIDGCSCRIQGGSCFVHREASRQVHILNERTAAIRALGEGCIEEHPRSFVDHYRKPKPMRQLEDAAYERIRQCFACMWEIENPCLIWRLKHFPWEAEDCHPARPPQVHLIYGDPKIAALYEIRNGLSHDQVKNYMTIEELRGFFERDAVDLNRFSIYLLALHDNKYGPCGPCGPCISSLKMFASTKKIYEHLSGATVALSVASKPLYRALWAPETALETGSKILKRKKIESERSRRSNAFIGDEWLYGLSLAGAFACIAMFESGAYDLDPCTLEHIFAMSSENSLFVAAFLLDDPIEGGDQVYIKRVIGNIGRAGMAMLMPPQDPQIRKPQLENWQLVNHALFDGQPSDSFQHTTHHLSFTDYTMPCNVGGHGARDTEVFFVESLVSVYDREKWVADLDVLTMPGSSQLSRLESHFESCDHAPNAMPHRELIAVDNWEELLDRAKGPVVVRAWRNPVARLATATVSVKQDCETVLVREGVCWTCATREIPQNKAITFIQ